MCVQRIHNARQFATRLVVSRVLLEHGQPGGKRVRECLAPSDHPRQQLDPVERRQRARGVVVVFALGVGDVEQRIGL
jgi:hypothetical protein